MPIGAIAIGAGIMSVAVWREKVYEFVVGVHTSLMLSVFLLALGFAVSSENVSILMAWINVLSLLIVEWLYHRHDNTVIKNHEVIIAFLSLVWLCLLYCHQFIR